MTNLIVREIGPTNSFLAKYQGMDHYFRAGLDLFADQERPMARTRLSMGTRQRGYGWFLAWKLWGEGAWDEVLSTATSTA